MTDKLKLNGAEFDIESVRAALKEYDEAKEKESELFHGYTMQQWQRIIDERHPDGTKKYLCEFINNKHEVRGFVVGSLREIHEGWDGDDNGPFVIASDHNMANDCFQHCRPAQRYGVLIPHFGGEKPDWLGDQDMIVWWKNEAGTTLDGRSRHTDYTKDNYFPTSKRMSWGDIVEFIAMPAEA